MNTTKENRSSADAIIQHRSIYPGERVEEVSGGVGHFLALRLFSMAELSVHRTEIQRACYLVG